jgi:hypothetical protein
MAVIQVASIEVTAQLSASPQSSQHRLLATGHARTGTTRTVNPQGRRRASQRN